MKKKDSAGLGMTIPKRMRMAGMTFYLRNGQVVGRESSTHEKRSNTLPQFIQRQKMRHTTALWKMLRFCDVMFTERRTAYQNFASLATQLPAVVVTKTLMDQSSFLMPGIPMSDGILPMVKQELGEVNSTPALLTDLKESDRTHHVKLRLYTAVQNLEYEMPRVRFSMSEVSWWNMAVVDGRLALVGEEFADKMKGWALVKVIDDRCSPQTIVTRCTLYQQYTTKEALERAADSYGIRCLNSVAGIRWSTQMARKNPAMAVGSRRMMYRHSAFLR